MLNLEDALRDKRILIIDDLVDARSSLKKMVTMLGANIIDTAADGRDASELIAEHNYDIIFSDYNLETGKDGQQILEEARYTNRVKASALFIMVTGENAVDMVMGALEYEPDNYITKPYTLSMLRDRLIRILSIKNELSAINAAIDAKDANLAIKLAEQKLKESPKFIMPLTRILGRLYLQQKNYPAALEAYERLLKKRSVSWAHLGQAICFFYLGRTQQSLALIEQAIKQHPMYVQCYDWHAKMLLEQNRPIKAQQQLQKAIDLSPKAVLRQIEFGQVALLNKDYLAAEKAYDQAVKLGRFSCYKNSTSYLKYAESAQQILTNPDELSQRKQQQLADKSLRLIDEVKQDYHERNDVLFDASLIEHKTYIALHKDEQAQQALERAEGYLQALIDPDIERQFLMAEVLIDSGQAVKAQNIINRMLKDGLNTDTHQLRLAKISAHINPAEIQSYINQLNSQGIELYSQQNFVDAVNIFDQAVSYQEATTSVLMNALQTKISYIETQGNNINYLKDCYEYLHRIGKISEDDKRFQRFTTLKNTFNKLWQQAKVV